MLMKRVIDTSEVLGTVEQPEGLCELCASADAGFEDDSGVLEVRLEAHLRPSGFLAKERHFHTAWLPLNEKIRESCSREESREMAREIFHRWVCKVRQSAPQLHQA